MTFTGRIHTLINLFLNQFRGFKRHELYYNISPTFPTTVHHQFTKCVFQGSMVILASPNFQFQLVVFASHKKECGLLGQTSAGQMLLQTSTDSVWFKRLYRQKCWQPTHCNSSPDNCSEMVFFYISVLASHGVVGWKSFNNDLPYF